MALRFTYTNWLLLGLGLVRSSPDVRMPKPIPGLCNRQVHHCHWQLAFRRFSTRRDTGHPRCLVVQIQLWQLAQPVRNAPAQQRLTAKEQVIWAEMGQALMRGHTIPHGYCYEPVLPT